MNLVGAVSNKTHYTNTMNGSLTSTAKRPMTNNTPAPLVTEAQLTNARKQAASVLHRVYWEEWTPLQGIARWPVPAGQDDSLDVAFTALAYLEGDEDRQQSDPYWLDAQLAWLRTLEELLATGEPLPARVLATYRTHAHPVLTSPAWDSWLLIKPIVIAGQMIQHCAGFFRQLFSKNR